MATRAYMQELMHKGMGWQLEPYLRIDTTTIACVVVYIRAYMFIRMSVCMCVQHPTPANEKNPPKKPLL